MSHHVCKASHLTAPYSLLYLWSRAAVFCTPPQKFKEHQKKTMIIGHYPLAMNDTLAGVNKSHFENGKPHIQIWKNWAPGMHLWDFKRAGMQIWDLCMLKMSDTATIVNPIPSQVHMRQLVLSQPNHEIMTFTTMLLSKKSNYAWRLTWYAEIER